MVVQFGRNERIDIFSEKCGKGYNVYRALRTGFMPTSEDTSVYIWLACEGKKGMGVGRWHESMGDGEGARWHMVLMFLSVCETCWFD